MCLFCETRVNTINDLKKEIRELTRLLKQHESENRDCKVCNAKALKHPERRWYHRNYYQANRDAKLKAAKERHAAKRVQNEGDYENKQNTT